MNQQEAFGREAAVAEILPANKAESISTTRPTAFREFTSTQGYFIETQANLIISYPYSAIQNGEGHDSVNERFALWMLVRRSENLHKHSLEKVVLGRIFKFLQTKDCMAMRRHHLHLGIYIPP